jgi:hypothetical protein
MGSGKNFDDKMAAFLERIYVLREEELHERRVKENILKLKKV